MDWITLALLASLMWSLSNLIDKYVLEKWLKNPLLSLNIIFFIDLGAAAAVYFSHGLQPLSLTNLMLVLVAGAMGITGAVFYFKALNIEEVSRIVPLFNVSPLFILVLATIFLGEVFTPGKYLGIALLIIGSVLITLRKIESKRRFHWGTSMWLMLGCLITGAIVQVITKYLLRFADYWSIFGYLRLSNAIILIPFLLITWKELVATTKKHGNRVVGFITLSEALAVAALLVFTIAISLGPVTLVNSVGALQPLFVLAITIIFSRFFPHIMKEEIDKHTVILKAVAIALMIAGMILVA